MAIKTKPPVEEDVSEDASSLLEEMIRDAEKAPEPGTLHIKDVLHRGDAEMPAPIVAASLQSAGYVFIYDTQTGERSLTNRNMLPAQLKKTREDGSLVFTTQRPKFKPKRGSHKCALHPDDPKREHYDVLGLPVCNKSNLLNEYQAGMHMQRRHPTAWKTIEDERLRKEKEDDRAFQRSMIEMARSK